MTNTEPIGKIKVQEGELDVLGYIRIARDEREVMIAKIADGSYAFETKSWLLTNNRQEVSHRMRFSEKTMMMLLECMHLGAMAWKIDIEGAIRKLAESETELKFEYGGDISNIFERSK